MAQRLQNFLFDDKQIADFEQRLDAASQIKDRAERLLSFHTLRQDVWDCDFLKPGRRNQTLGLLVLSVATIPVSWALPLLGLPGLLASCTALLGVGMLTTGFFGLVVTLDRKKPFQILLPRVRAAIAAEVKVARLEDMRHSPQLNDVLKAFPDLAARFRDAALCEAIKGEVVPVAPLPSRLVLQKSVQVKPALSVADTAPPIHSTQL